MTQRALSSKVCLIDTIVCYVCIYIITSAQFLQTTREQREKYIQTKILVHFITHQYYYANSQKST